MNHQSKTLFALELLFGICIRFSLAIYISLPCMQKVSKGVMDFVVRDTQKMQASIFEEFFLCGLFIHMLFQYVLEMAY